MTNGTKILIGIAAVAAIVLGIVIGVNGKKQQNSNNTVEENNTSVYNQYLEENNTGNEAENINVNNVVENETSQENTTINVTNTPNTPNTSNTTSTNTSNKVTGKEEQESQAENTGSNDIQTAINLAKKEWAIDVDSFSFNAELKENGIYTVTVRNKTNGNAVAVYTVNVKAGTVTE